MLSMNGLQPAVSTLGLYHLTTRPTVEELWRSKADRCIHGLQILVFSTIYGLTFHSYYLRAE